MAQVVKLNVEAAVGWVDPSWPPWALSINYGFQRKNMKKWEHRLLRENVNKFNLFAQRK